MGPRSRGGAVGTRAPTGPVSGGRHRTADLHPQTRPPPSGRPPPGAPGCSRRAWPASASSSVSASWSSRCGCSRPRPPSSRVSAPSSGRSTGGGWRRPSLAEIGSYFCFAAMQYELLKAGHLRPPWTPLVKLSFASQAITNSLPIGNAVASVYGFRWFRRFGADNTLAVWALAGTLVAASVSLSLLAILGLGVATQEGASPGPGAGPHRHLRRHAGHRVALRLRAAAPRGAVRGPEAVGGPHRPAPGRHRGADRPHHRLDDRRAPQLDPDRPHRHLGRR